MAKKLVIVESPAKARTVNKILGKEFAVKSSVGHVRDLPQRTLGVDVEHGFEPKYVVVRGKRKIINELRQAAQKAEAVYLAPDPDREGEAIAWHLQQVLRPDRQDTPFYRVTYNEITPRAVRRAFENPGSIDQPRVDAQQARRILDRLVGYTVSPMLWRRIRRGLSAGRVQSVALRLVCEREEEIRNFVPEAYWVLGAMVRKLIVPLDPFRVKLAEVDGEKAEVKSEEQAAGMLKELEGRRLRVRDVATRTVSRRARPPFITSSLQQAGSNVHGFSPRRTMRIAQSLYEGVDLGQGPVGLITYMRTDSFNVSRDAQEACRQFVRQTFGNEYCPEKPNVYRSRRGSQEAHEAIRPTDVTVRPETLKSRGAPKDELRLYTLIWQRFVASQMVPARILRRKVRIEAEPPEEGGRVFLFEATASDVAFPGYMKASGTEKTRADEEEQTLPELAEREPLECLEWISERKETKPPSRYGEATLVRTLERNGVGRPSTYAQIIETLYQRDYVVREKSSMAPTELGERVNALLVASLGELFDVGFTASMEETLDEVEKGAVAWTQMLERFYEQFQGWMKEIKTPTADPSEVASIIDALACVRDWAPEVKRGRRTYSDRAFVESLREQLTEGSKAVSQRQFETLVRIACRYRDQAPAVTEAVGASSQAHILQEPGLQPPRESTLKKLALLERIEMNQAATSFVASLRARTQASRQLTEAQMRALDNIVLMHAARIDNFEALRAELGIEEGQSADSEESRELLASLEGVRHWRAPVTRGKRKFDDRGFYTSLSEHFERKGYLSARQRAALKKLVLRYSEQVANFEELAERYELRLGRRAAGGGEKT